MGNMTLAIDFDGVLHEYKSFHDPLGKPMPGAVDAWYRLYSHGYNLVVFTCREDLSAIREWMHKHFDFEKNIGHFYEPEITNIKPIAIAYIDDRAIRFTNWDDIRKYFC